MSKRVMSELVNQYSDDYLSGKGSPDLPTSHVVRRDEADLLTDLFQLVSDISALFVPTNPSPEFINELGLCLAAAATPADIQVAQPSSHRKLWFGAILSGSLVSAVGVLLVWFIRHRRGAVAAG